MKKSKVNAGIGKQLKILYVVAILIPVTLLGSFLTTNLYRTQEQYHSDMLHSYNISLRRTMYDISSWIYTISESVVYNEELIAFLCKDWQNDYDGDVIRWQEDADTVVIAEKQLAKYTGLDEIRIYTDTPNEMNYKQFRAYEPVQNEEWYKKARAQYSSFWISRKDTDIYGNEAWNLTLVRKMVLPGSDREAVVMIKVKNSYLDSRSENTGYVNVFTVNDMPAFYSNDSRFSGLKVRESIDYARVNYTYNGKTEKGGKGALISISSIKPFQSSDSMLYLVTYDFTAIDNIQKIVLTCLLVLALAALLPILILTSSVRRFTGQVVLLRKEMNRASRGGYTDMPEQINGSRELAEAYTDLLVMVENIKKMEARQYEAQMREQNIQNEQQKTEIKMLASQINPHFLYNTLEMIRMKAVTTGDREVANVIKLLGKSMRYVLENTGTTDTTVAREVDHILNYLQIQKLRFGERVEYEIRTEDGMVLSEYRTIPLLLQPIVENAISYGLEGQEKGHIEVSISRKEEKLCIDISDDGSSMTPERLVQVMSKVDNYTRKRNTSSIGLYNINRRIKLNYGEEYGVFIESTLGKGTRVRLLLPVITEEADKEKEEKVE